MYEEITVETLKASLLANLAAAGWSTTEGSFVDLLAGPTATELYKRYQADNVLEPMFYVDETSGTYIDKQAALFGITRKAGIKAVAAITFTGSAGTVIPAATAFLTAAGLVFNLDTTVTLDSTGAGTGTVTAAAVGETYNIDAGTLIKMYVNLSGLTSYTNAAATGGVDAESDSALVTRLYARLQTPATSGNAYAYQQWALSVDGVGAAKVIPLWAGAGTVKVVVAGMDREPVEAAVVTAVSNYIGELRPIGATVTVASVTGVTITVAASVTVDSSTTVAAVQAALVSKLDTYVKSVALSSYTVLYNRIVFLLLDIDGVVDYTTLTVNGGTANISLADGEVPVLGEVTVNAAG